MEGRKSEEGENHKGPAGKNKSCQPKKMGKGTGRQRCGKGSVCTMHSGRIGRKTKQGCNKVEWGNGGEVGCTLYGKEWMGEGMCVGGRHGSRREGSWW